MQNLRDEFRRKEAARAERQAAVEKKNKELEAELAETEETLAVECLLNEALRKAETALVDRCITLTDDIQRYCTVLHCVGISLEYWNTSMQYPVTILTAKSKGTESQVVAG